MEPHWFLLNVDQIQLLPCSKHTRPSASQDKLWGLLAPLISGARPPSARVPHALLAHAASALLVFLLVFKSSLLLPWGLCLHWHDQTVLLTYSSSFKSLSSHSNPYLVFFLLKKNLFIWLAGSVVAAGGLLGHGWGLSCFAVCGTSFPKQGSSPRPLYWKADSQLLDHQGSPWFFLNEHLAPPSNVRFCFLSLH